MLYYIIFVAVPGSRAPERQLEKEQSSEASRGLIVFPNRIVGRTRCWPSSETRIITRFRGGGRRKGPEKGVRERVVEKEKLTPVSRAAATYFTGTSGLASHAGEHNSSGATRCLSLSFPRYRRHIPTHFARTVETGGSHPALIYGIARLYIRIRPPFRGGGGAPCTENGFCQGVTELFIHGTSTPVNRHGPQIFCPRFVEVHSFGIIVANLVPDCALYAVSR